MDEGKAIRLLENVVSGGRDYPSANDIFQQYELQKPRKPLKIPSNCILMHSVTITATTIRVQPVTVELSNRIIRQYQNYADRFLRVRFEDDDYRGNSRIYATTSSKTSEPFVRIKRVLLKGIDVAGRHYEFLAWGNSQLRDHGVFFFAPKEEILDGGKKTLIDAALIVKVAGDFDNETIIAKRAARIGQCFSTTRNISGRIDRVTRHDCIPDIVRNGYMFSDGCGKISQLLAAQVAMQLKLPGEPPSAYQFRLGGCKGILVVAPDLKNREVKIRSSQFKFPSDATALEIIRCSECWTAYLNRQLILVLSALGIPIRTFLSMQQDEIDTLHRAIHDDSAAIEALYDRVDPNRATVQIADLIRAGFRSSQEPFVMSLLHLWRAWSLQYLKDKAHIHLSAGALILGCVDETATLRGHFNRDHRVEATRDEKLDFLPEIFVQVTDPRTGRLKVISGLCTVARNPSLHMGDIRVCKAVDNPKLRHLRDVLVLPQTGDRDISSMCSGGDLDGDDYIVCWDQRLIPGEEFWFVEPFHYEAPEPIRATWQITQADFIQFFHQYMKNDFLGRIATNHLIWADHSNEGLESEQCLRLVGLHSMAVDYPKTGVPAVLTADLLVHERPHFMVTKFGKTYRSRKILGLLYDNVEKVKFSPKYELQLDPRILKARVPDLRVLRKAAEIKETYDEAIRRIMAQHEIKTEFEVFSTFCLDHSKASKDFKFHEELGMLSRTLQETTMETIIAELGAGDHESLAPFAVAAYHLVANELARAKAAADEKEEEYSPDNMPLISFPWVMHETLCKLVREASPDPASLSALTINTDVEAIQGPKNAVQVKNTTPLDPWASSQWSGHGDPLSAQAIASLDGAQDDLDTPVTQSASGSDQKSNVDSFVTSAGSLLSFEEETPKRSEAADIE